MAFYWWWWSVAWVQRSATGQQVEWSATGQTSWWKGRLITGGGHSLTSQPPVHINKPLKAVGRVWDRVQKLGDKKCQLLNPWISYFSRETAIYSDYHYKQVFTDWNEVNHTYTMLWGLYWGEKINYMFENYFLSNYSQKWVFWGVFFEALGDQMNMPGRRQWTPCWPGLWL